MTQFSGLVRKDIPDRTPSDGNCHESAVRKFIGRDCLEQDYETETAFEKPYYAKRTLISCHAP